MKHFILMLALFFLYQNINAQDTTSVEMYKNENYAKTKNIKKAQFAIYKISNTDGSISTINYSFENNRIESSRTYKGEEPTGIWITSSIKDGKEIQKETDYSFDLIYCRDVELGEDIFDINNIQVRSVTDTFILAKPQGNTAAQGLMCDVSYPQKAIDHDIEGSVYIRFVVNEDGSLSNFCIISGSHVLLDKAAMEHAFKLSKFSPAIFNGKAVKSTFVIPVVFKLL